MGNIFGFILLWMAFGFWRAVAVWLAFHFIASDEKT